MFGAATRSPNHFAATWGRLVRQQPVQIRRQIDHVHQVEAPRIRHLDVEHIRQAVAEHSTSNAIARGVPLPLERLAPRTFCGLASILTGSPLRPAIGLRQRLGVAIVAGWRELRASNPPVHRVVVPLDLRILAHRYLPLPSKISLAALSIAARAKADSRANSASVNV